MVTFVQAEGSVQEGKPLTLVKISTPGQNWYLTSADTEVVHDLNTYIPSAFTLSTIEEVTDVEKATVTLTVPSDHPLRDILNYNGYGRIFNVTVFGRHHLIEGFTIRWKGRVINIELSGGELQILTESVFTALRRLGVRRRGSNLCPHSLYSDDCGVDKEKFAFTYTIIGEDIQYSYLSVSQAVFTGLPGYVPFDNYSGQLNAGYLEFTVGGVLQKVSMESRKVNVSTTNFFEKLPRNLGLAIGNVVKFYPACGKTALSCKVIFHNIDNYGGLLFVPTKNPFNGSAVY